MRFPHVCKKWGASAQCFPKHANFAAQTASARPILSAAAAIHEGNDQQPPNSVPGCTEAYSKSVSAQGRVTDPAHVRQDVSERAQWQRLPGRWRWQTAGPGNCGPRKLQAQETAGQETAGPRNCRPKQLPADDRHAGGLGDWPERSRENGVADEVAKASPCPKPKTASAISSRRLGGRPARRLRNTQDQRGARTCGNLLAGRFGKPS